MKQTVSSRFCSIKAYCNKPVSIFNDFFVGRYYFFFLTYAMIYFWVGHCLDSGFVYSGRPSDVCFETKSMFDTIIVSLWLAASL